MAAKTGAAARREQIRQTHFPSHDLWAGEKETGWCAIPRTLPLILGLLDSKAVSGKDSPSTVYLELLTRLRSDGVVEMVKESEHAFAAGYEGTRALRTWTERMQSLEKNGFIATKQVGNDRFAYVALVHPTTAVQKLVEKKCVPDKWMAAYLRRKLDTKEPTHEKRVEKQAAAKNVIPIKVGKEAAADTTLKPKVKSKAAR